MDTFKQLKTQACLQRSAGPSCCQHAPPYHGTSQRVAPRRSRRGLNARGEEAHYASRGARHRSREAPPRASTALPICSLVALFSLPNCAEPRQAAGTSSAPPPSCSSPWSARRPVENETTRVQQQRRRHSAPRNSLRGDACAWCKAELKTSSERRSKCSRRPSHRQAHATPATVYSYTLIR